VFYTWSFDCAILSDLCAVAPLSINISLLPYQSYITVLLDQEDFFYCFPRAFLRKRARCWCRSWLRHCSTSRKVAGSIPDVVTEIFHWYNPSGCTMALGLTQPLTEMSTRNISWGVKTAGVYRLTTLPPSCADCLEIWELQRPGTLRACTGQ